jgi:hypothetical protein
MSHGQHDVERATAGLVMALFLASALLLAALAYFVMQDADERSNDETESTQAIRLHRPPALPAATRLASIQPPSLS